MSVGLTRRQLEVLQLMAEGFDTRRVAEALGVAPATVKTMVATIYSKLGVKNAASAVATGFRRGLLR